ncbi:DUF4810 domain-containing protein [Acetobacter farinalis]|uniref:DUF4810 domain-containing protein n=1 Tax=Acetobacter farinalis TaxID=1260984 RepID=A0ABT3Q991_9PROT|nr:DUF4810 domain-containing protein [Acetobacter farinalis]MCX2561811.1 DUF4810 domain-containing protein [Acetobacter farinalis]NHO30271.1 DUF4810 domain-containing protein [Acetobacter farinalis]
MSFSKTALAGLGLLGCLAACSGADKTPPLYSWQDYPTQQYLYLKGQTDPQAQITVLEKDVQKAQSKGLALPPGFHAHLGMLYATTGRTDLAQQEFSQEKTLFPESATYMDFLLKNLGKKSEPSS